MSLGFLHPVGEKFEKTLEKSSFILYNRRKPVKKSGRTVLCFP